MTLARDLYLPVPDIFPRSAPGLKISPELVLINLEILRRQLTTGDLDPAEFLGPPELSTYQRFTYPKRQIEWLGGRLAAKQAVLQLTGRPPSAGAMREWLIGADEHGRPFFKTSPGERIGLSISHSHGLALAMTVKKRECGLDIQKISSATIRVREKFCARPEERIIAALALPDPQTNQAAGLTLLWAVKEALRKARGGHPLTGFTAMELTAAVRQADQCWLFSVRVGREEHLLPTFFYKDFAIALSVITNQATTKEPHAII
jgi:phosphopantetheinyl transferase